ncbi:MAG: hypothetical protein SGPRY_005820 [Prymnesium sp.]
MYTTRRLKLWRGAHERATQREGCRQGKDEQARARFAKAICRELARANHPEPARARYVVEGYPTDVKGAEEVLNERATVTPVFVASRAAVVLPHRPTRASSAPLKARKEWDVGGNRGHHPGSPPEAAIAQSNAARPLRARGTVPYHSCKYAPRSAAASHYDARRAATAHYDAQLIAPTLARGELGLAVVLPAGLPRVSGPHPLTQRRSKGSKSPATKQEGLRRPGDYARPFDVREDLARRESVYRRAADEATANQGAPSPTLIEATERLARAASVVRRYEDPHYISKRSQVKKQYAEV